MKLTNICIERETGVTYMKTTTITLHSTSLVNRNRQALFKMREHKCHEKTILTTEPNPISFIIEKPNPISLTLFINCYFKLQ